VGYQGLQGDISTFTGSRHSSGPEASTIGFVSAVWIAWATPGAWACGVSPTSCLVLHVVAQEEEKFVRENVKMVDNEGCAVFLYCRSWFSSHGRNWRSG
jgi:hypothetical protein